MPPGSRFNLTEWCPLFTRLGVGRGTFFPPESAASQRVRWPRPYAGWSPVYRRFSRGLGCLPARPLALALRRLAPLYRRFFFCPDTSLLPSRASDLHWTLLFCLSTGAFIYPSPLSWECSLSPVKGSWTSPQMFCPMSESLSREREGFQDNAIHKKGSLLLTRVRAFCRNQRSGAGSEKALSRGC